MSQKFLHSRFPDFVEKKCFSLLHRFFRLDAIYFLQQELYYVFVPPFCRGVSATERSLAREGMSLQLISLTNQRRQLFSIKCDVIHSNGQRIFRITGYFFKIAGYFIILVNRDCNDSNVILFQVGCFSECSPHIVSFAVVKDHQYVFNIRTITTFTIKNLRTDVSCVSQFEY